MVLRTLSIAVSAAVCAVVVMTGCSSMDAQPTVTALTTVPKEAVVTEHGSCDIQQEGIEAQDVPAFAEINTSFPSFVVLGDFGESATIRLSGANRCVWIKGSVLQDTVIQVEGDGATIIVEGSVDVEASVNATGKDSLIWLKGNSQPNLPPDTSADGQICIGLDRVCLVA